MTRVKDHFSNPHCPQCGSHRLQVVKRYYTLDDLTIVRRRLCVDCKARFYTVQEAEDILPPHIVPRYTKVTKNDEIVTLPQGWNS